MVDKLYHRANPRSSFRPIARFVVEIQRIVAKFVQGEAGTKQEINITRVKI